MARSKSSLTARQSEALLFIRDSTEHAGVAPTLRELCEYMGYSAIGSAQDVVAALRRKGFLETPEKQSARSLILADRGHRARGDTPSLAWSSGNEQDGYDGNSFSIHCLGRVPAGNPVEAVEERVGTLRISISMFSRPQPKRHRLFAVQAFGESMVGAGILGGDWLVVESCQEAANGTIVIARVGEDATVKRLMQDDGGWYLKPENPEFEVIRGSPGEAFEVVGRVVALQRAF